VFSTAGLRPFLVSASKGSAGTYKKSITANNGLKITTDRTIANTRDLEVLVVPGGTFETIQVAMDTEVLNWIKAINEKTVYTTSVCTGSWIIGAAGLLQGKQTTSNGYRAAETTARTSPSRSCSTSSTTRIPRCAAARQKTPTPMSTTAWSIDKRDDKDTFAPSPCGRGLG
jgi:putative intracellular protease/amidase